MDVSKITGKSKDGGQTVIETVLMLFFLLVLFFLIAEFARAWYLKNSLNNAARIGARVAAVTPNLSPGSSSCQSPSGPVFESVCSSPGLNSSTVVTVSITDDVDPPASPNASAGDTIKVALETDFETFVPAVVPSLSDITVIAEASMRYE